MTKLEAEQIASAILMLETGRPMLAASKLKDLLRDSGHKLPPPVLVPHRDESKTASQ